MRATTRNRPARVQAKPTPPLPTDDAFALKLDAFGWAVKAHEEAVERYRQAQARYLASPCHGAKHSTEESDEWERWLGFVQDQAASARNVLIQGVVTAAGLAEGSYECEKLGDTWDPVSFEYRGTLYIVSQDPEWRIDFKPLLTIVPPKGQHADWMDGDGPGGEP